MRIALFHNLPSGGGKRALYEWTRRLADKHTIDVYSLDTANHAYCDVRPFVSEYHIFEFKPHCRFEPPLGRLDQFQRWRDLGHLERLNRQIAKQIDAGSYNVLFVNPCMYTFLPAIVQFTKIPAIYYLHEAFGPSTSREFVRPYIPNSSWRKSLDQLDPLIRLYRSRLHGMQNRSVNHIMKFLANSQYTRKLMHEDYGINSTFIPCGVNTNDFRPLAEASRGDFVISVGEMAPRKGFDFIVKSLGKIPSGRRPALKLACNMVKRNEIKYIKDLAVRTGVNLEIVMNLDVDELRLLYNRARLCVYAPVKEPFGLIPLEAMACGTPVIGVKEGGVPESIVHECTGLLVERDEKEFGAAIQLLLENRQLAETFGCNGREYVVKNWTWERSASMLEPQLAECIEL